jgi:hypothetical protein
VENANIDDQCYLLVDNNVDMYFTICIYVRRKAIPRRKKKQERGQTNNLNAQSFLKSGN